MAKFLVTTPVKEYQGERAGAFFVKGRAEVDDTEPGAKAALLYFARHGYGIEPASGRASAEPEAPAPAKRAAAKKAAPAKRAAAPPSSSATA